MGVDRPIRLRAGGVILRDDAILLVECDEQGIGLHYNIPGGGVEPGEPLHEAVKREVREETCLDVDVGRLLLTWEFLPDRNPDSEYYGQAHAVGFVFACTSNGGEPRLPDTPDAFQIGVRWVPLSELANLPLLPKIGAELQAALNGSAGYAIFLPDM